MLFFVGLLILSNCWLFRGQLDERHQANSAIKISYRLDNSKSRFNNGTDATLLLQLQAAQASRRIPVALVVVLDTSTSTFFDGQQKSMQDATNFVLDNLLDTDYFGIVTFALQARELVPFDRFNRESVSQLKQQVQGLQAQGPSSLLEGVRTAMNMQLNKQLPYNVVRGIVLITDGYANVGITKIDSLSQIVEEEKSLSQEVLRLFTIATSGSSNLPLLEGVASSGEGAFLFLSSPTDIHKAFGLQLGGLISTYYQDVVLTIQAQQDVEIYGLRAGEKIILENQQRAQVSYRDLRADENREILVYLSLGDTNTPPPQILFTVELRYFGLVDNKEVTTQFDIRSEYILQGRDPFIDVGYLRVVVADVLSQAKSITSDSPQSSSKVSRQITEIEKLTEEVKSGGLLEKLDAEPSHATEITSTNLRRMLLNNNDDDDDDDHYSNNHDYDDDDDDDDDGFSRTSQNPRKVFDSLELSLQDAQNSIKNLNQLKNKALLTQNVYTILGVAQTLGQQRLSILSNDQFESSEALTDIYITPVQAAVQRGENAFGGKQDQQDFSTYSGALAGALSTPSFYNSIFLQQQQFVDFQTDPALIAAEDNRNY